MLTELLKHPDFKALVKSMREDITKDVMNPETTPEQRDVLLQKYHLIDDLMSRLGAAQL